MASPGSTALAAVTVVASAHVRSSATRHERSGRTPTTARAAVSGSPAGQKSAIFLNQLIRCNETIDASPRLSRCRAKQCNRRVAHLVAAIDGEGSLSGETGLERTGVVLPLRARAELASVLGEALGGVLFRIGGNGHEMHALRVRAEPLLELPEDLAHEGTDRAAAGENEIEHDRSPVVHLLRQRNALAVIADECNLRDLIVRDGSRHDSARDVLACGHSRLIVARRAHARRRDQRRAEGNAGAGADSFGHSALLVVVR